MTALLCNDEEVLLVLEGLVDLDDLRMVKRRQNAILVDDILRVLDKLLLDALDSSHKIRVILHFGLVNGGKRTTADDLDENRST